MSDYNLKAALASVGEKRMNFALYRGQDKDQLLITPNPPSAEQLRKVEKESGKLHRVLKGVCFREADKLIFAMRIPAAPAWELLIEAHLKERNCEHLGPIEVRQLDPAEPDEVSNGE